MKNTPRYTIDEAEAQAVAGLLASIVGAFSSVEQGDTITPHFLSLAQEADDALLNIFGYTSFARLEKEETK